MFPQPLQPGYFGGLNELLLDAVPASAMTVVEAGCAEGRLGAELRARVPGRKVIGIEIDPGAAELARARLDEVVVHDLMAGPPPIAPGTVDVITFGDVLEHLVDPEAVLVGVRNLLVPGGRVIASIPNIGHYTALRPILRGDFMYQPLGLLDATHLRFFTYATIFKLFLDAGYVPRISRVAEFPIDDASFEALVPALLIQRVDPERARAQLGAFQYIVEAEPVPAYSDGFAAPLTIACLVNDTSQLESNLLRSPVLAPGTPHQLVLMPGRTSAAEGLRSALKQAEHDIVVLVQQDVFLPRGWDHAFRASWNEATTRFGQPALAGVWGIKSNGQDGVTHAGRVLDRDRLLAEATPLPALVESVDEVLLALPRDTPLAPDPALGFHLYGADLALQARSQGLPVVVLDALCFHNSLFARLDDAFHVSREQLLAKWDERPLQTNMGALEDVSPEPAPVYWPTALRQELSASQQALIASQRALRDSEMALDRCQRKLNNTQEALAAARTRVGKLRDRAQRAEREVVRIKSSRWWRARTRVISGGRKVAGAARSAQER